MIYALHMHPIHVLLHDLRSTHNVGSIFRSADGAGVHKVYLSGTTPTPVDRFGRERSDIRKVSLGAEKSVPWEYVADPLAVIGNAAAHAFTTVAVEQTDHSIAYTELTRPTPLMLVFGNEPDGLPTEVIDVCDLAVEIPMLGTKESLNVSVAAGVVLYHLATLPRPS